MKINSVSCVAHCSRAIGHCENRGDLRFTTGIGSGKSSLSLDTMAWFGFFGVISVEFFSFSFKKGGGSFLCLERDVRNGWPSPPKFSTESIFRGGRQQKGGPIRLDQQVSERRFHQRPGKRR